MTGYFRAVALDVDGTIAQHDVLFPGILDALRRARASGLATLLVTGRTLGDLRATFPGLESEVSLVVAENGAVLSGPKGVRLLAAPVDPALGELLDDGRVEWSAGAVLLACSAADELAVLGAVRHLGLDYQLVTNRGALMVLPAGVTKATGLLAGLAALGLSRHNTVGVGDAENDHSLLDACEIGIAAAGAVESLLARADLVLDGHDGCGVVGLLDGALLAGGERCPPTRWQVELGTDGAGLDVVLPASQVNVLVAGGTGEGKSYLAGLLAEQLVTLGYSVVVLDAEGDHGGLGGLPGVRVIDAADGTPIRDAVDVLRWPGESVVVDMSSLAPDAQQARVERLAAEIESERAARGVPQWVVVEEAHRALGRRHATTLFDTSARGCVLVTWRPDELAEGTVDDVDIVVAFGSGLPEPGLVDVVARVASMDAPVVAAALADAGHRALLARRSTPGVLVALDPGPRRTAHLRHEHKYEAGGVAPERRFYVRTEPDVPVGVTAGSLAELAAVLADCDPGVLRHHCPRGDFSRWIDDVFHDRMVVEEVSRVERTVRASSPSTEVESARSLLVAALARARAER